MKVYELKLDDDRWKFNEPFPDSVKETENEETRNKLKIFLIKDKIRMETKYSDTGSQIKNPILPEGFCVFKSPISEKEALKLWSAFTDIDENRDKLGINYDEAEKFARFLFSKGKVNYSWYDFAIFFQEHKPRERKLLDKFLARIFRIYGLKPTDIDEDFLKNGIKISIIKYYEGAGIPLHIDNLTRTSGGPIFTISIGPAYTYYDMVPVLYWKTNPKAIPIRFEIPQGAIATMESSARYEWGHAIPYDIPYERTKFTILILTDRLPSIKTFHIASLDMEIPETKVCKN